MKTALLVIALGAKYRDYAKQMLVSAEQYFVPHTPIIWTDDLSWIPSNAIGIPQINLDFPGSTLARYRFFHEQREILGQFDQLYYSDADMRFVGPATEEIFSKGITSTLHPGFMVERESHGGVISSCGEPERRRASQAFIWKCHKNKYYCGGFNGGNSKAFLKMSEVLHRNIETDARNGIQAKWHDESHLNHYLWHNPPARVLTPSYCYPENYDGRYGWEPEQFPPVLLALDKQGCRT